MSVRISTALAALNAYQALANYPIVGYENIITTANVASTTAETGYPITNVANPMTHLVWRGVDSGSDEFITIMTGGSTTDYMAIARHNLADVAAKLTVQYESAPSTWTTLVEEFTPTDNSPIIMRFVSGAYATIRLRIKDATDDPQIAVMYLGEILTLERKIYVGHTPAPLARQTNVVNAHSENGNFLGRIVLSEMTASQVVLNNLTPAWVRASLDPFLEGAKEEPFFFAWRPQDYPDETSFAWMTDNPQPTNAQPNGMMSCSFQFTAVSN